jgi:hypothetical protein
MSKKNVLNQIKTLLNMEVKLEQMKLDNGTVIEAEMFEPDYEVFVVSDEDKIPLPMGEYTMEDGKVLVVAQDGIIGEIKEAAAEEPEAPVEEEVVAEEAPAPTSPKKIVESISKELFFSEIEKLRNEIEALKQPKEELSAEVVEDVKVEVEEEVKPLVHNPEKLSKQKVNYNKLSLVEFLNNRKNNK